MYNRSVLGLIKERLDWKKVIIIYGARQTGKTTLCKELIKYQGEQNCLYLDCERASIKETLESENMLEIKRMFQDKKFIVLDEAQVVKDIGR
ncbi:MAG: AAA family ATPase, partial [Patescibacteria group bacterium]